MAHMIYDMIWTVPQSMSTLFQHPPSLSLKPPHPPSTFWCQQGPAHLEAEWSELSTELLHPGIKILSREAKIMGQANSLSCFPGRRFKGNKSTTQCQINHSDHFGGND